MSHLCSRPRTTIRARHMRPPEVLLPSASTSRTRVTLTRWAVSKTPASRARTLGGPLLGTGTLTVTGGSLRMEMHLAVGARSVGTGTWAYSCRFRTRPLGRGRPGSLSHPNPLFRHNQPFPPSRLSRLSRAFHRRLGKTIGREGGGPGPKLRETGR